MTTKDFLYCALLGAFIGVSLFGVTVLAAALIDQLIGALPHLLTN